jgi:hypothetical protein
MRGGYVYPKTILLDALIWFWLKWHKDKSIRHIREDLRPVIIRAITLNADPTVSQRLREDHDSFLIQLAVLTGDRELMGMAAESVIEARRDSKEYQYYQSWTGILKYRILGDENKVRDQYELMQQYKALRYYLFPTKTEISSFVAKDYRTLRRAIKRRCEQFWKFAAHWNAIHDEVGDKVLDLSRFDVNFFWPWVEGTFAKLAYLDGAELTYDSIWLPLDLVKAIEE